MMSYFDVWDKCLNLIKDKVKPQSYATWFSPIIARGFNDSTLRIEVPNKFFYEWIEENYISVLKEVLHLVIGKNARLEYIINEDNAKDKLGLAKKSVAQAMNSEKKSEFLDNIFLDGVSFNKKYLFETFIEGQSNKIVKAAAATIAESPGGFMSFNPFIVYGGVGLGKTHIAQAIGNYIKLNKKEKKVAYVSSEMFVNQYIISVKNNDVSSFINRFIETDVLIIDDVQFFADKEKTQETFFHIFNHLHQSGKQIVMTSDMAPQEMRGLQDRLLSRFKWGITAELQVPDYRTKFEIIQKNFEINRVRVEENVVEYIASIPKINIREIEGIVNSLSIHFKINKSNIGLELTKQIASSLVTYSEERNISMKDILDATSKHYSVDAKQICGNSRSQDIALARKVSMHITKNYTDNTLKAIGDFFGKRHHSTVLHSINSIDETLKSDKFFKKNYDSILIKLEL